MFKNFNHFDNDDETDVKEYYQKNKFKSAFIISITMIVILSLIFTYIICDINYEQKNGQSLISHLVGDLNDSNLNNDNNNNNDYTLSLLGGANAMQLIDCTSLQPYASWSDVAEEVVQSVVYIDNYQMYNNEEIEYGSGSGIILSSDGYIVTNSHVIDGATRIEVILYDDTKYEAQLVGQDIYMDLAVIKILNVTNLKAATFGDSSKLRLAEEVMAIGNPGGYDFKSSVTLGIVSAKNRPMDLSNGYVVNCIQTDAAINPGNSGGALVNIYGQVVGINSAKIVAEGYESLGFAISSVEAQDTINDLIEFGYIKDRATLGVTGTMVTDQQARFYDIPMGLLIAEVKNQSIIAAGVVKNDIIVKIEDQEITSVNVVNSILQNKKIGDSIKLNVYKMSSDSYIDITITLADYNEMFGNS